jgi:2-polyprenyl-3-methyl-5-hydroxy-6-metoxy-1,4-benzoquinol methylase
MDLGLVAYRPFGPTDAAVWDATYAAGGWAHMAELIEAPRYAALIAYLSALHPGAPAVLDVGCGEGIFRSRLGNLRMERYLGIDPSATAITKAKALEDDVSQFMVATDPTPDLGTFDVVVCSEMLFYLWNVDRFLAHVHSVLRPGGHLLSSNWQHPGVTALQRRLDAQFPVVAAVEITTREERRVSRQLAGAAPASRCWRVSCHRRPED